MVIQDNNFIGIPWKFNGRDKNSGVDCIGLLVEFYKTHQWQPSFDDGKLIDREWFVKEKYRMLRYFIKYFEKTRSIAALEYGDIVLFEVYGEHHTGIYLEYDKFLSTFPPKNAAITSYSFIDRLSYWGQFFVCGFKRRKAGE
ncbi:NlpC/P60 family protein [Anaerospora sp.]|uniref:NlpC/P60 family protein n=1 Tax=Anaerospora sp. TaxID=1960278 RepID=UPI0028A020F2|nr:NlpC/P60 family protein [Anaerospora sp.]